MAKRRRKRINKRVAIILGVVVGLIFTLGVVVYIAMLPKDPQVYIARADVAYENENFRLAAQEYGKAIHNGSKDATVFYRAAQASFKFASDKDAGLSKVERGKQFSNGRSYLNSALQADPDYQEAQLLKTVLVWQDIVGARRRGDEPNWERFIGEVSRLIELDPENAEAHFQRGFAQRALMPRDEATYGELALVDFQKAVELDPTNLTFLIEGQIALLQLTGKSDQAQAAYLAAVERDPDNVLLRANYVTFLYPTDPQEAFQQIEQAIAIAAEQDAEDKFAAQLILADYYRWERQFDESIEAYELAESMDPAMFGVYVTHTRLLRSLGRVEESTEVMRKAMRVAEDMLAGADEAEMSDDRRLQLAVAMIDLRYRLAGSLLDEISIMALDVESRDARLQEARDNITIIENQQDVRPLEPRYYRILGRIFMYENDLAEALENFLKGYEGAKASGMYDEHAGRLLLQMYIRDSQLAEAEAVINEYLKQPGLPGTLEVMLAKAQILMRYRNYDEARRTIGLVLEINPNHAVALALRNRLNVEVDELRPEEIPADVTLTRGTIEAMIRQALRIWTSGDKALALRQMVNLYERDPEDLKVIVRLIQMYQAAEMKEKAQAVLAKAIETFPDNDYLKFNLELMEASPAARYQMRLERAEQIEDPLARALALAGVTSLNNDPEERLTQTIAHLRTAAEIDPRESGCLEQLFRYCLQKRDWEQAQWAVELAEEKDLDLLGGRLYKARLAAAQNEDDLQITIDILKDILRDKPQSKQARLLLGRCYRNIGDYDQAADAFRTLYDADHSYATAAIEMMDVTLVQRNSFEADEWIEIAYRLAPYNINVRNQYLRLRARRGDGNIDELIGQREQGLRTNPQDFQNRLWLAQLYEKAGRNREAERMYVSIYQDGPDRLTSATILVGYYDRMNMSGPVDSIISDLLDTTDNDNDKAMVYVLWGQFRGKRNLKLGLKAFDDAIATAPTDPRPYEPKASLLARNGRWAEAAETMAAGLAMIESIPDHSLALARRFAKAVVRYRIEGGQLDVAEALMVDLMANHPDDVAIRTLQGVITARRGNNGQAIEIFTAVLETDPDYAPARAERARIYAASGEFSRASEDLKIAAKVAGGDNSLDMQRALVYEQMHDEYSARRTYQTILDRSPSYTPAIAGLLKLYFSASDWTQLDALLADAKRRYPEDPGYYLAESTMWKKRNNPTKSLAALAEGVRIAPNNQSAVWRYLVMLVEGKQYQEALSVAERYAKKQDFVSLSAAIKARIYLVQGNTDQARELFTKAVAQADGRVLQEVASQMKAAYGVDDAAIELTDIMISSRPDDWHVRVVLASIHTESQAPDQLKTALVLLAEALDLTEDPANLIRIYVALGQVNYMLEDFPAATVAYRHAIDFEDAPADARTAALNNLAYMYAENLDQLDEAVKYAEEAARLSPRDPNVLDTYGWTLARLKRYDKAIRYLNMSISIARQPVTLYHQGFVYEQTDKRAQAARNYQEVKTMLANNTDDPLYQQAQDGIERLKAPVAPEE